MPWVPVWLLRLYIEDHTKSGLAGHHSLIGRGCIFEGQHLGHGCDSVRGAELQAGLVFNRRASETADDRAAAKDEIGTVDLNRIVAHADDHQLTAWCEPGYQRRHGCPAGRGGDDRDRSAEFL